MTSQGVAITGAHRSGTSLFASWMEACGMPVSAGHMMGTGPGNPKGHYEDRDFVSLHRNTLKLLYPMSGGWRVVVPRFLRLADPAAAAAVVRARSGMRLWGWKDPRTTLFLLHWAGIVPGLKFVLLWRPAVDVVGSTVRRGMANAASDLDVGPLESAAMWRAHNLLVLKAHRFLGHNAVLLPLDAVIADPALALEVIDRRLGLGLEQAPLHPLFEPDLMVGAGDQGRLRLAVERAVDMVGCRPLEARLAAASDLPPV